jgi:hypothetical protein
VRPLNDPEFEYYRDGCLAERERADQAEDELEQLREAMGAPDDADLISLAQVLRSRHDACTAGLGELQHELLRAKAMLYLAWANAAEAGGQSFESWTEALVRQMEETI